MQSADQGRCRCAQCQAHTDAEYHALLNTRTAQYVRSRYAGKTIGVNSWGLGFQDEKALPVLARMSKDIDYLIDVHDSSRRKDAAHRKRLIGALSCDLGTIGGPQVEPPQHWSRDRWFLPTVQRTARHLQQLFADGGLPTRSATTIAAGLNPSKHRRKVDVRRPAKGQDGRDQPVH